MTPVISSARHLAWYTTAWLLTGSLLAALLVSVADARWPAALLFSIPLCLVYGLAAASAFYVCRSLPMARRDFLQTAAIFGAASLLSGLIWSAMCQAWNRFGHALGAMLGFAPGDAGGLLVISEQMSVMLFVAGGGLYLLSLLGHDALIAFDDLRQAENRAAEARVQARDAELQVLRTQINPHFLFNSLNSISALTAIDAAAARAMTLELAQFFRQTLALSEQERIPLADEIALCEHFLAIEKIRFGNKLQTDIQVSAAAAAAPIPPMLLQPCVENAIKHGIRDLTGGGTVAIRATTRADWLHIAIENPVDADPTAAAGNGTGLRNIKRRLASLYGHRARITWNRGAEKFVVEVAISLSPAA